MKVNELYNILGDIRNGGGGDLDVKAIDPVLTSENVIVTVDVNADRVLLWVY